MQKYLTRPIFDRLIVSRSDAAWNAEIVVFVDRVLCFKIKLYLEVRNVSQVYLRRR